MKSVKVGGNLLSILELIITQEKDRGYEKVSYRTAGEILSKRIEEAGGLKG